MSSWCLSTYSPPPKGREIRRCGYYLPSSPPPTLPPPGDPRVPAERRSARPVELLPSLPPPNGADFLLQQKSECHFLNGTQWVQYLDRYFYDRQEFVCFDSDLGKHVAITALGEVYAETMNSDKQIMQYQKARVDRFCRHNYEALNYEPTVTISPTKMDPASPNTILLCTARGFYPLEIEIQWLKNGELEEEGVAFGEELQNGDWTYQLQVMLETQPQWGDIYTCQVGHVSLEAPITVQWARLLIINTASQVLFYSSVSSFSSSVHTWMEGGAKLLRMMTLSPS
uniref:Ig-like domain-containing protein n=1 Tax=Pseudonaja textilis TaxID=8673 RepID=A0A670ZTK8_PSETE